MLNPHCLRPAATYPLDLIRARLSIASASIAFKVPMTTTAAASASAASSTAQPALASSISTPAAMSLSATGGAQRTAAAMYHTAAGSATAVLSKRPQIPGMWEMTVKGTRRRRSTREQDSSFAIQ